jgi:hypothetical protein
MSKKDDIPLDGRPLIGSPSRPVVGMIVAQSILGFASSARSALSGTRLVAGHRSRESSDRETCRRTGLRCQSLFLEPSRSLCVDGWLNLLCVFSARNRITSLSLRPSAPSPVSCRPHSARPDQAFAPRLESDRGERRRMTAVCVRREKAALSSGRRQHRRFQWFLRRAGLRNPI